MSFHAEKYRSNDSQTILGDRNCMPLHLIKLIHDVTYIKRNAPKKTLLWKITERW